MKQRVISSLVGLGILAVVIGLYNTYFLNFAIAVICIIGLDELLHGAGYKHKVINYVAYAYAAVIPFFRNPWVGRYMTLINYTFAIILMLIFLGNHQKVTIQEIAMTFLFASLICYSLTTIVASRDNFGSTIGLFYNLVALVAAWGTDTSAYFAGRFFGKRKMAPNISPNKTVEGAIGGGIFGSLIVLGVSYAYFLYQSWIGITMVIHYGRLIIILPLLVVSGMIGDLTASAIKRQYSIKDFGHIMPGHGGVLDRFDSVLAVAPMVYVVVVYLFPLATVL